MAARQIYWSLRRYMIRRDLLAFAHGGSFGQAPTPANSLAIGISEDSAAGRAIAHDIAAHGELDPAVINDRLVAGSRIVHAHAADGSLLAWGWIALPDRPQRLLWESGLHIEVPAGVGYLFDFETVSAARNHGLYRQLLDHAARMCYRNGAKTVGIYCRADNIASKRGILAAGFTGPLPAQLLRLGPLFRLSFGGRVRWGLSMSAIALTDLLSTISL